MFKRYAVDANTIRSEVILPEAIPRDEHNNVLGCPKCKGNTFMITGCFRRGFTETVEEGNELPEELLDDTFRDIDSLFCPACKIRFIISDEASYHLYKTNQELITTLASLQGLAGMPVSGSKPN